MPRRKKLTLVNRGLPSQFALRPPQYDGRLNSFMQADRVHWTAYSMVFRYNGWYEPNRNMLEKGGRLNNRGEGEDASEACSSTHTRIQV